MTNVHVLRHWVLLCHPACRDPKRKHAETSGNQWLRSLLTSIRSAIVETQQGKTSRQNRIDIRPLRTKQVHFEVQASEPQPTQHQSPEEEVSQKASEAAVTPSSTPETSSAVQTRSGRTVKVPDKLNLWDDCFF